MQKKKKIIAERDICNFRVTCLYQENDRNEDVWGFYHLQLNAHLENTYHKYLECEPNATTKHKRKLVFHFFRISM